MDRKPFSKDEIKRLWEMQDHKYAQIVLMLIYSGCRISEFLDLKKENVHLEEQYFDIIASKTENGLRKVPISDKTLPFFKAWYESSECKYLLHTPDQKHFTYRNYYDKNATNENRSQIFWLYFSSMNLAEILWAVISAVLVSYLDLPFMYLFVIIFSLLALLQEQKIKDQLKAKLQFLRRKKKRNIRIMSSKRNEYYSS